jgi:F-type H+-transporting ATPase subunit gamma
MSGLKEIRTRLTSITSTRKITSAMKMVSAAKFHKAQESIYRFEPYYNKTISVLSQVLPSVAEVGMEKWFNPPAGKKNIALVIITSNSSMCGGFNQNLIKKILEEIPTLFPDYPRVTNLSLFCLGKKGCDFFLKKKFNVHSASDNLIVNSPTYNTTSTFANYLIEEFVKGIYDMVYIAYNEYKNPAVQTPSIIQYLPILFPAGFSKTPINPNIIFEPNQEHILRLIIPKTMKIFFHKIILENAVGEHGARMTAMHQATDNASELLKELKLQYNKARQAAITKEILEIVSGAEALKGKSN